MHLDIHPAHWGEHATVRAISLMGLHLKHPSKQVLVRLNPQEGLVDNNEARQLQHRVRRKVLQLDAIFMEESMKEVQCWDREPMLMEVDGQHRLAGL
jgi:hypothetical protein